MTIIVPGAEKGGYPYSMLLAALDAQTPKGSEWATGLKDGVHYLVEWRYDLTPEPRHYPIPEHVEQWLQIHADEAVECREPIPLISFEMPEAVVL